MVKVSNSTFEQRLKNLSDRRTDLEHLPCSSFYDHDSFDKEIRSILFLFDARKLSEVGKRYEPHGVR